MIPLRWNCVKKFSASAGRRSDGGWLGRKEQEWQYSFQDSPWRVEGADCYSEESHRNGQGREPCALLGGLLFLCCLCEQSFREGVLGGGAGERTDVAGNTVKKETQAEYFDTETLETEMFVEGYKAGLVKDTSYKGLWKVSFMLKEF